MHKWLRRTHSKKMWISLSLTTTALCSLCALARLMCLATLFFVVTVVVLISHTTTPAEVSPAHVFATSVELLQLVLSSLRLCLAATCLFVLAIINAFITFMSALASCCSWSLRFLPSTCYRLVRASWMAHSPVSAKMQSVQYSDL